MSSLSKDDRCGQADLVAAYALGTLLPAEEASAEAHLSICPRCQQSAQTLRRVVGSFAAWPTDVLRPPANLWKRLLAQIGHSGADPSPSLTQRWTEPAWEEAAPGISCKLLSSDSQGDRVAMLVRLAPGVAYPPHTHSGIEELHLLDGELWIDQKKLHPGDYNRAERGTSDRRVWSETGCTCLLITAPSDVLG
ncbi:MAG TPA: cupin domain-containing protein [Steroidobacteraceae bacterium]|jgi:anti-sigma factor ChrR (cupin superfamily)